MGCFHRNPEKKWLVFFLILPKYSCVVGRFPHWPHLPRLAAFILKNPPGALGEAWVGVVGGIEFRWLVAKFVSPKNKHSFLKQKKMAAHRFLYQSIHAGSNHLGYISIVVTTPEQKNPGWTISWRLVWGQMSLGSALAPWTKEVENRPKTRPFGPQTAGVLEGKWDL